MAIDRVRPFKIERPAEGGTQLDENFTEVDIGQDYLDCNGVALQVYGANTATADSTTSVSRSSAGLQFADVPNGSLALAQLLTSASGKPGSHNATPDIIHWLANGGPGDGFVSGAFRQTTMTGIMPAAITWYTSAAMSSRMYGVVYTYSGLLISKAVRTLYANNSPVRTVTDTITYASPFAPIVSRTWT